MNKAELLSWLREEYAQWQALLDQIGESRMDQPGVNGDWSIKDIVAHLVGWNRWLVARIPAAQRGAPQPSPLWSAQLHTDDEINTWIYEAYRERSVREVLDESNQVFQQLLAVVEGLPEDIVIEPAYRVVQFGDQRFSASEFFDHFHDDHEPDVRAWLARTEEQVG
jgi:hypothetical protein